MVDSVLVPVHLVFVLVWFWCLSLISLLDKSNLLILVPTKVRFNNIGLLSYLQTVDQIQSNASAADQEDSHSDVPWYVKSYCWNSYKENIFIYLRITITKILIRMSRTGSDWGRIVTCIVCTWLDACPFNPFCKRRLLYMAAIPICLIMCMIILRFQRLSVFIQIFKKNHFFN